MVYSAQSSKKENRKTRKQMIKSKKNQMLSLIRNITQRSHSRNLSNGQAELIKTEVELKL